MKHWIVKLRLRELLVVKIFLAGFAFWHCLPEPLFDEPVSFVLVDRNGALLGAKIAEDEQWRFPPQWEVPDKFGGAITAFEDKRFYRHPGFDPLALARSLIENISKGEIVSGGSTLTMQVIRLARNNPSRTYVEKLIELVMAVRLELSYSKEEILALYASHAPFGGNVVGVLEVLVFPLERDLVLLDQGGDLGDPIVDAVLVVFVDLDLRFGFIRCVLDVGRDI